MPADPWASPVVYVDLTATVNIGQWCNSDWSIGAATDPTQCRVNGGGGAAFGTVVAADGLDYTYPWAPPNFTVSASAGATTVVELRGAEGHAQRLPDRHARSAPTGRPRSRTRSISTKTKTSSGAISPARRGRRPGRPWGRPARTSRARYAAPLSRCVPRRRAAVTTTVRPLATTSLWGTATTSLRRPAPAAPAPAAARRSPYAASGLAAIPGPRPATARSRPAPLRRRPAAARSRRFATCRARRPCIGRRLYGQLRSARLRAASSRSGKHLHARSQTCPKPSVHAGPGQVRDPDQASPARRTPTACRKPVRCSVSGKACMGQSDCVDVGHCSSLGNLCTSVQRLRDPRRTLQPQADADLLEQQRLPAVRLQQHRECLHLRGRLRHVQQPARSGLHLGRAMHDDQRRLQPADLSEWNDGLHHDRRLRRPRLHGDSMHQRGQLPNDDGRPRARRRPVPTARRLAPPPPNAATSRAPRRPARSAAQCPTTPGTCTSRRPEEQHRLQRSDPGRADLRA